MSPKRVTMVISLLQRLDGNTWSKEPILLLLTVRQVLRSVSPIGLYRFILLSPVVRLIPRRELVHCVADQVV